MTVQVSNSVKYYVGDGSTSTFDYDFIVFNQSHLKVYLGSVEQSTGFTISGIGSQSGGSVVFSVPPVNGTEVILIRDVPFTQLFDYVAYDSFPAEAHERNIDLLVMMCQYLRGVTDRAMVTAIGQSVWDMKGQEITNAGEATASDSVPTLDQTETLLSSAISQVIPGISFTYAGFTFVSGGTLTSPAQVVYDPATSSFWSWAGSFPEVVAAGSDPLSDPQWINQTENSYRTQGETNDRKMWEAVSALLGYGLVAGSFQEGGTISDPLHVLWDKIGGAVYYRTAGDSVVVPPLSSPGVGWTVMTAASVGVGDPVLSAKWVQKRSAMWTGYAAADGQEISRSLYPDAWAAIAAGLVPVCTKAEWIADPAKRGRFHTGDGSTTFGLPDYNGVYSGSYGPVYLGGGTTDGGAILRDRIQNITGRLGAGDRSSFSNSFGSRITDGAFALTEGTDANMTSGSVTTPAYPCLTQATFDASRVARTGDTTRPITAEGCIAIKLFGAVQNAGSADAAALATAVAALESKYTTLNAATCIVNASGQAAAAGFVRETVSATMPANIAINTRYVFANPIGANKPVRCTVYLYVNGKWSTLDGSMAAISTGYGAGAFYVYGEGIILQTGRNALMSVSTDTISGHANTAASVTSAPCFIHVEAIPV